MSTEPASPGTVPAGTDAPVEQAAAGEPSALSELEGTAPPAGGTVTATVLLVLVLILNH